MKMKSKFVIVFIVSMIANVVSQAQQTIYYEKTDTCYVQIIVSKAKVVVNPTYNSILGKEEWDIILKEKREFKELEEITNILDLFDFTVADMKYVGDDLVINFEKRRKTSTLIIKNDEDR